MLRCTSKLAGLFDGDFVYKGKTLNSIAPHWIVAITAAPFLAFEGYRSRFDEGFESRGHGGLLNKLRKSADLW
jgi:hypothetical protein